MEDVDPILPTISDVWQIIAQKPDPAWAAYAPDIRDPGRKRAAMELFCSILWHLELAASLTRAPAETGEDYYERVRHEIDRLPWEAYAGHRSGLSVSCEGNILALTYAFRIPVHHSALVVLQSTLLGDAALRLDSARETVKTIALDRRSCVFAGRAEMEGQWLDKTKAGFKRGISDLQMATALVVAFRDRYMHGEASEDIHRRKLATLRFRLNVHHGHRELLDACVEVLLELMRQTGFEVDEVSSTWRNHKSASNSETDPS